MIHFLCTRDHAYTLRDFLEHWAPELRPRLQVLPYESLSPRQARLPGPVIFSDLERIRAEEWPFLFHLEGLLRRRAPHFPILNAPSAYQDRHALQKILQARGGQAFRVFRPGELPPDLRYPVFIRREDNHEGPQSPLLQDAAELQRELEAVRRASPASHARLLVIEFLDCRDADGWFRKFGVCKIGPRLVPRHILFSPQWLVKQPDGVTPETAEEEAAYLRALPHAREIHQAFQDSGLDYGRIDYSFYQGRMQIWEINSNPAHVPPVDRLHPLRVASQQASARELQQAIADLDAPAQPEEEPRPWASPLTAWMLAWRQRRFPASHRL